MDIWKSWKRYGALLFLYVGLCLGMLLFIVRAGTTIHSDGPSGFGELMLKMLIIDASVLAFCVGAIMAGIVVYRRGVAAWAEVSACVGMAGWLLLMTGVMVMDVCTNDYGYCRNWTIFIP